MLSNLILDTLFKVLQPLSTCSLVHSYNKYTYMNEKAACTFLLSSLQTNLCNKVEEHIDDSTTFTQTWLYLIKLIQLTLMDLSKTNLLPIFQTFCINDSKTTLWQAAQIICGSNYPHTKTDPTKKSQQVLKQTPINKSKTAGSVANLLKNPYKQTTLTLTPKTTNQKQTQLTTRKHREGLIWSPILSDLAATNLITGCIKHAKEWLEKLETIDPVIAILPWALGSNIPTTTLNTLEDMRVIGWISGGNVWNIVQIWELVRTHKSEFDEDKDYKMRVCANPPFGPFHVPMDLLQVFFLVVLIVQLARMMSSSTRGSSRSPYSGTRPTPRHQHGETLWLIPIPSHSLWISFLNIGRLLTRHPHPKQDALATSPHPHSTC